EAGILRKPSGPPNRIMPSVFQVPVVVTSPAMASHKMSGAPPAISIRFSFPPVMNARDLLSGDQNGKLPASVPGNGRAVVESSGRRHKELSVLPVARAEKTTSFPSGDTENAPY